MEVLEAHSDGPSRRVRPWVIVAIAVVIIALVVFFTTGGSGKPPGRANTGHGAGGTHQGGNTDANHGSLDLLSSNPLQGASNVASDTTISLTFSAPISLQHGQPSLSPAVQGSWSQPSPQTLEYDLSAPLIPQTTYTVTVPDGSSGLRGSDGSKMSGPTSIDFTVAIGDYTRLQQLLADLDYLPLSFAPSGPAPATKDMAIAQAGTFNWRWANQPPSLMAIWSQGSFDEVTRAAVEAFENQNNLAVDGIAGPEVWSTLFQDVASQKVDANPYVYVLVNKVQPENLTLWNNGTAQLTNVLVNTGAPGADTVDGNYAVFEHVRFSDMKGTNPDGSKYNDPNVPYASYFNGGDALHGFIRAQYGYPQSNGCVEMTYANAALVWPLTPIGTLVSVEGPATPGPPPTTTTTTAPTTTTTTTAPPPPPPTTAP